MNTCIIIPVRYGSSRFPGKPLAQLGGESVVSRVVNIAQSALSAEDVYVATDDERIESEVKQFGANVIMTSQKCRNGTERVLEALNSIGRNYQYVVNVQGDAPLIPPTVIRGVIEVLEQNKYEYVTPAVPLTLEQSLEAEARVKTGVVAGTYVVTSLTGRALYFSKNPIPCRLRAKERVIPLMKHVGIYGYTAEFLERFVSLPPTPLEQLEQLEQLRALEHDLPLQVVSVDLEGRTLQSIDNPSDIQLAESIIEQEGEILR